MEQKSKIALVTGGSRGLGRDMARWINGQRIEASGGMNL